MEMRICNPQMNAQAAGEENGVHKCEAKKAMERMFTWSWKPVGALATPTLKKNLRPVFSAAQARRGRGSVLAGSAFHRRGRKEVGQVKEELD